MNIPPVSQLHRKSKKIPIQPDIMEGPTTTGNKPKYVNMEIIAEPPGGVEQSLTTTTSTHEYIIVGCTSGQPGQTEQSSTTGSLSASFDALSFPFVFVYFSEILGCYENNIIIIILKFSRTSTILL